MNYPTVPPSPFERSFRSKSFGSDQLSSLYNNARNLSREEIERGVHTIMDGMTPKEAKEAASTIGLNYGVTSKQAAIKMAIAQIIDRMAAFYRTQV